MSFNHHTVEAKQIIIPSIARDRDNWSGSKDDIIVIHIPTGYDINKKIENVEQQSQGEEKFGSEVWA